MILEIFSKLYCFYDSMISKGRYQRTASYMWLQYVLHPYFLFTTAARPGMLFPSTLLGQR